MAIPSTPDTYLIIVAGGTGTRLWPISRKGRPKQFLSLLSDKTFIEETYHRAKQIFPSDHIFIVAPETYGDYITKYLPEFPPSNFMGEPDKKGTTAAYGYTATYIGKLNPKATVHIIAADDYIKDDSRYQRMLKTAARVAVEKNCLVIYGTKPRYPAPSYGYIKVDLSSQSSYEDIDIFEVKSFHEKPDLPIAESYQQDPSFFWHCFGFTVSLPHLLSLIKEHDPETFTVLQQLDADLELPARLEGERLKAHYAKLKESNIEVAVLEKSTSPTFMITMEPSWSDIGSWDRIYELKEKDVSGNTFSEPGKIISEEVKNSLVITDQKPVALVGVSDLIIVDTPDALLICAKDKAANVKKLVEKLKTTGQSQLL
ncbi:mannose-1-phosphate guanylyltransferase [Candidatus Collierbacteria bacterium]|nr:mannose-1-phosphate guanylyltransferase [Candidatus Collierbacteria bacterium]